MEKLSMAKKYSVIRHYLSGQSYDEVAVKDGISKGTVSNVVNELKAGKFPEASDVAGYIEQLRGLSTDLKRANLTPGQCAAGLMVLARINACGLEPADIERWPQILKSVKNEDESQEFVRLIYSIQEVQQKTGLSLEALEDKVHSLEKKAADLAPVSKKLTDCRKQLAELTKRRDVLATTINSLESKRKLLEPKVNDLDKREKDLLCRIKDMEPKAGKAEATLTALNKEMQILQNVGFTFEALTEFSQGVQVIAQRHAVKPGDLRTRLLHELGSLDQGLGLESVIAARKKDLNEVEQAIKKSNANLETARCTLDSLKQEKTKIEESIKETRQSVCCEIASIVPISRDTISQLTKELHGGIDKAVDEVKQLRNNSFEVGKEVGRYQEIVESNSWLKELLALVQGYEGIEAKQVRSIALSVVGGVSRWIRVWNKNSNFVTPLSGAIDSLIRELEKWKT